VASVSTLLFNGNPLLRYDGYYILSDLLETPNLQQQSTAVVQGALSRWLLDVEPAGERLLPERRRGVLAVYAVASWLYRLLVVFGILWFLYKVVEPYRLQVVVELLGVLVIGGLVVRPLGQAFTFLSHPARRREVNWLRFSVLGGAALAVIVAVLLIPLPHRVHAPVIVEPRGASRVYVAVPGKLVFGAVPGARVAEGDPLANLESIELEQEIVALRGEVAGQETHYDNLRKLRLDDPTAAAQLPAAQEALNDLRQRLDERLEDQRRLAIVAPAAGVVLPPRRKPDESPADELPDWTGGPLEPKNAGAWLETGTMLCLVGDPRRLEGLLVIDQADIDLVRRGQTVRMQLDQTPGGVITGTIDEIARLDLDVAPPELIAAGVLPLRNDGPTPRLASTVYQARVKLDAHEHALLIRTSGDAKVLVDPASLGWRLWRYVSRTFRFDL
jgi:putative peptide zinc metalloprotease protein